MTWIDRYVQEWRINVAAKYIPHGARVLDIGCADGALFQLIRHLQNSIGIDPDLTVQSAPNAQLIRGSFPEDLPDQAPFDAITMLAVLEHIPAKAQNTLAKNCFRYLRPDGKLIITVPSPQVDHILAVLRFFRLIHGMSLEQHYGYDVNETPKIFRSAGFQLDKSKKFQLGLNNLFVFTKPA